MRHLVSGKKLGRTSAHKKALFRNLVTSLILHDRIETTLSKAKALRSWADKMITLAKRDSVHARRQAMSVLKDRAALQKLFTVMADRFRERAGGYTRILKLGNRHGDNAPMAIIEYLTAEVKKAISPKKGGDAAPKKAARAKKAAPAKAPKSEKPGGGPAKKAAKKEKAGK